MAVAIMAYANVAVAAVVAHDNSYVEPVVVQMVDQLPCLHDSPPTLFNINIKKKEKQKKSVINT